MKILLGVLFANLVFVGSHAACANGGESDGKTFYGFLDAVTRGDLAAIRSHLDENPADIDREADPFPYTALNAAASNCDIEAIRLLLGYGADAGRPHGGGAGYGSPLLSAAYYCEPGNGFDNNFAAFKLIFHSIEPEGKCIDTYPALEYAIQNPDSDRRYAIYMLENNSCVSSTSTRGESTFRGALENDVKLAELMIPKLRLNSPDGYGYYPLHHAVQYGDKSIVAVLLTHDIYLNPIDHWNKTPLDYADFQAAECRMRNDDCPEEWRAARTADENEALSKEDYIASNLCHCSEEERRKIDHGEEIFWMLSDRGAVYSRNLIAPE